VLIKVPKQLALLEQQLRALRQVVTPETRIIAAASSGAVKTQWIRRAFFHASEVVVVPRIFSNSASVELCTSRAFAAAIIKRV
jgi:16S rRNA G1207 methylase RsmC